LSDKKSPSIEGCPVLCYVLSNRIFILLELVSIVQNGMLYMWKVFSTSISLGMHILREHSGGICLPDVDFNFDPDFICAITSVPGE